MLRPEAANCKVPDFDRAFFLLSAWAGFAFFGKRLRKLRRVHFAMASSAAFSSVHPFRSCSTNAAIWLSEGGASNLLNQACNTFDGRNLSVCTVSDAGNSSHCAHASPVFVVPRVFLVGDWCTYEVDSTSLHMVTSAFAGATRVPIL